MNWHLIQTRPNTHFLAEEHLRRQGFEVFLPLIIKTTKSNRKFVNKTVPLFPSYLFMGSSSKNISWKSVNGTRGISKAVTLDGVYRPINPRIIQGLQYRCNKYNVIQKLSDIVSGDRVKIERGPFTDFICTVEDIKDDQRAWILIDLLSQQTKSEVSLDDLSKIS